MKNKYTKLHKILIVLIVLFTFSVVNKTLQNDTFFLIAMGNKVLANGIDSNLNKLTFHENIKETSSRFDVIIALVCNAFSFQGIYAFVLIVSLIIALVLFRILQKKSGNILIAFGITVLNIFFAKEFFTARAQIISYLMLLIEISVIEDLLETNKKRYIIYLAIISIIVANFHSSVWPMCFILYLPYIAEYIFGKLKISKYQKKLTLTNYNIKYLLTALVVSMCVGILNTNGITPYTDMIKVLSGCSKDIILELNGTQLIGDLGIFITLVLYIMLLWGFESKIRVSDLLLISGLTLMSLMATRNCAFLYLFGAIVEARLINNLINKNKEMDEILEKLSQNNKYIAIFILIIAFWCFVNYTGIMNQEFIDEEKYPVEATEFILNNFEIDEIRLYNHFNFGSYLEYKEIPAFIDSRSGIFTKEFNDCTILEEWSKTALKGTMNYQELFDKYQITHVLLYKDEIINTYICKDDNYNCIYEDDDFVLYEKVNS